MKTAKIKFIKKNLFIAVFAVLALLTLPLYDKITNNYLNSSLKQSAITYAVVRSINAAVSVIQESSLTVGVGIEGNLALGQALDPINDATERFSDLLTLSIWSLGSEKIIYELSKLSVFSLIMMFFALLALFYDSKLLKNMLVIFIAIRLFMPFSATISNYFDKFYFIPHINKNIHMLKPYAREIKTEKANNNESLWSKFSDTFESTKNSLANIQEEAKYYISHAEEIISALVSLASLYLAQFILNVLLLPLLLIYLIKNMKLE